VYYLEFETTLIDEGSYELQNPTTTVQNPNSELIVQKNAPAVPPTTPPVWYQFPK
jgi:hypothetical protein